MLLYRSGNIAAFSGCDKLLKRVRRDDNFTFSKYTTYGAGGGAKCAFFPATLPEARAVYDFVSRSGKPYIVLGNGSNVLASDSCFNGCVISTKYLRGIARINDNTLFCLAGTPVSYILSYCKNRGLGGLEYLAGIPASIGGIAFMNGGAGGHYIGSNVLSVKLYNGKTFNLSNKSCDFKYKHSTMRDINAIILGVFLSVFNDLPQSVEKHINENLSRRAPLPKGKSCGCVFKNPQGQSAGRIIDECGLGGYGDARAYVSPEHCNFIINNGATSTRISDLINEVKSIVFSRTGINLEEEVVRVGNFG